MKGKVIKVMPMVESVNVSDVKKTSKCGLTKSEIVRAFAWYVNPEIFLSPLAFPPVTKSLLEMLTTMKI